MSADEHLAATAFDLFLVCGLAGSAGNTPERDSNQETIRPSSGEPDTTTVG